MRTGFIGLGIMGKPMARNLLKAGHSLVVNDVHPAACTEHGVAYVDAPVSGGESKAVDGTLAIVVGGEAALYEQVLPVLPALAHGPDERSQGQPGSRGACHLCRAHGGH